MIKAIKINRYGSVDVLKYENINLKKLCKNELLIKQISIGVNYHDIYVRKGLYKRTSTLISNLFYLDLSFL